MLRRGPLIFLVAVLAILTPFVWLITQPFLTPLMLGGMLAIVMAPLHDRLRHKLKRPGVAALLATFVTVLLVVIPVGLVIFALTSELGQAIERLNEKSIEQGGWQALFSNTADRVLDALATRLPVNKDAIKEE